MANRGNSRSSAPNWPVKRNIEDSTILTQNVNHLPWSDTTERQKHDAMLGRELCYCGNQRWSPRGHILKSLALALASKVKSLALALASRPQVLENLPVLGSRTALFSGMLKLCGVLEKFFGKRFVVEIARKIFVKTFLFFFFGEHLRSLALASSIPVLGLESVCPRKGCPWPWPRIFFVSLASSLVSSTPPLVRYKIRHNSAIR